MTALPNSVDHPTRQLRGVGGWLAFFCVSLTIFAPITQLRLAWIPLKSLLSPGLLAQATLFRLIVMFVIYSGLALFSAVCGIRLWSENPRGPTVTKAYLVISPVLVIAFYCIVSMIGIHVDLYQVILGRLGPAVCWYAYLSTSERVRQTYEPFEPPSPVASPAFPEVASPSG
ncbi:MAG: DUF2569 family protein [Acidobacteria bacterium]|nr:DUF2569 family protein [Acidobacteriota bacterium]